MCLPRLVVEPSQVRAAEREDRWVRAVLATRARRAREYQECNRLKKKMTTVVGIWVECARACAEDVRAALSHVAHAAERALHDAIQTALRTHRKVLRRRGG